MCQLTQKGSCIWIRMSARGQQALSIESVSMSQNTGLVIYGCITNHPKILQPKTANISPFLHLRNPGTLSFMIESELQPGCPSGHGWAWKIHLQTLSCGCSQTTLNSCCWPAAPSPVHMHPSSVLVRIWHWLPPVQVTKGQAFYSIIWDVTSTSLTALWVYLLPWKNEIGLQGYEYRRRNIRGSSWSLTAPTI